MVFGGSSANANSGVGGGDMVPVVSSATVLARKLRETSSENSQDSALDETVTRPLKDTIIQWTKEEKLTYVSIQESKTKVGRDKRLPKRVDIEPEFQIFLTITLHQTARDYRSIVHFCKDGDSKKSHQLPSLGVIANTTQVVARISHREFRRELKGPSEGLPLNTPTQIRFQVTTDRAILEVGENRTMMNIGGPKGLIIDPQTDKGKMMIYLGHPLEKPARASVGHLTWYAHTVPKGKEEDAEVSFPLPQAEKDLLENSKLEIEKNALWAKFDGFFGFWLVANSLCLGMQTEYPDSISWWPVLDGFFLIIFMIEWGLRIIYVSKEAGVCALLSDGWFHFDGLVIFVSMVETFILTDMPGFFSALRLLRLLKLAKMVRLVRAFRELSLLLDGLIMSIRTLCWAFFLVGLMLYFFSVILVQISKWGAGNDDLLTQQYGSIGGTMWQLAQVSTLDNWGARVREAFFVVGGARGLVIGCLIILCVIVTALGAFNVVIGIICHTSFKIAAKQRKYTSAQMLIAQQAALKTFRTELKSHGQRPLFESDKFIGCNELFDALATNPKVKKAKETLQLKSSDFVALCEAFRENGEVEIQALCEAIGVIELQAFYAKASDEMINAASTDGVRPADFMYFQYSVQEAERTLRKVEAHTKAACTYAYSALSQVFDRTTQAQATVRMLDAAKWTPPPLPPETPINFLSVEALASVTSTFSLPAASSKILMPVDLFCGVLVLVNSIMQGLKVMQVGGDGAASFYIIVDFVLAILFVIEFGFRSVYLADLEFVSHASKQHTIKLNDATEIVRCRYRWLESQILCGFLPPLPPAASKQVSVEGFQGDLKLGNGVYKFKSYYHQCPFYEREGHKPMFLYCKHRSTWVIGEDHPASHNKTGKVWATMESDAVKTFLLPPLSRGRPDAQWNIDPQLLRDRDENGNVNKDADGHERLIDGGEPRLTVQRGTCIQLVLISLRKQLVDLPSLLDLLLIIFTVVDAVMLEIVRQAAGVKIKLVAISSLRVIRLVRLVMVFRVLQLFPQLQELFSALVNVWKTILWTVLLLGLILYSYAIYMVVMVRNGLEDVPELLELYGSLTLAIHTGWEMASFDNWEPLIFVTLQKATIHAIPTFSLAVLIGLGLMKMAVGVMCESAIMLTRVRLQETKNAELVMLVKKMSELRSLCLKKLNTTVIPQEVMEQALGIRLRPKDQSSDYEPDPAMLKIGLGPDFQKSLRKTLSDAKMTKEVVRKIYDKLDSKRRGCLTVDQLTRGGVCMKSKELVKIMLFANCLGIMRIRQTCAALQNRLVELHSSLDDVVKDAKTLIHREKKKDVVLRSKAPQALLAAAKSGEMSNDVIHALKSLAEMGQRPGVQALPDIYKTGRLKLSRGSGLIDVAGGEVTGHHTDFRKEVAKEDVLVFERLSRDKSGKASKQPFAVVVVSVVDEKTCRIASGNMMFGLVKQSAFHIVRARPVKERFRANDLTLSARPPKPVGSPRMSHHIFDWELQTFGRSMDKAWKERNALYDEYQGLNDALEKVKQYEVKARVLQGWCEWAKKNQGKSDSPRGVGSMLSAFQRGGW